MLPEKVAIEIRHTSCHSFKLDNILEILFSGRFLDRGEIHGKGYLKVVDKIPYPTIAKSTV